MAHLQTRPCLEVECLTRLCKRFKTPYSREMLKSIPNSGYLSSPILASNYNDHETFAKDYLLSNLLKKWVGVEGSSDIARASAFDRWKSAEVQCASTNVRVRSSTFLSSLAPFIVKVQRKVEEVIGVAPDMDALLSRCRWSGGSTYDVKRREASVHRKMSGPISATSSAAKYYSLVVEDLWKDANPDGLAIVRGNRGIFVPKDALVDRTISAEPTFNAFVQQAVGGFIRSRLLSRAGINLNSQEANQDAAFRAIFDGLATIDLSNASDTLAYEIVKLFLPPLWFDLMDDLRSPVTEFEGRNYLLSKFSSMGNAFTFELETLIFWAISSVASDGGEVLVYGDDIIVAADKGSQVMNALKLCGFTPNMTKSFIAGDFYESCGHHYFKGENVTPVYQKAKVDSLYEIIRLHNRLYRWGIRNGLHLVKDALALCIVAAKLRCKGRLPYVPVGQLDSGFLSEDVAHYEINSNGDYRCLTLSVGMQVEEIDEKSQLFHYAYKLRRPSISNQDPKGACVLSSERSGDFHMRWSRVWRASL